MLTDSLSFAGNAIVGIIFLLLAVGSLLVFEFNCLWFLCPAAFTILCGRNLLAAVRLWRERSRQAGQSAEGR